MTEKLPRATHQGDLDIRGTGLKIPCAVLEDGTRILRERSIATALGRKGSGAHWQKKRNQEKGAFLPEYVSIKNLEPFIDQETRESLLNPVTYKTISSSTAQGINATLLPKICDIWLKAREKGALSESQLVTAKKAEILIRGFAHIGIIALVDEATGYQEVRDRLALQKILEKYIATELQPWAKRFPDDFYKEMFRLKDWQYSPLSVKRPMLVGRLTNDLIYSRLAPGVLGELRRQAPRDEKGRLKQHFHRRLTSEIGHPKLAEHLAGVIALMKASPSWNAFHRLIQRALPKYGANLEFLFEDEDVES